MEQLFTDICRSHLFGVSETASLSTYMTSYKLDSHLPISNENTFSSRSKDFRMLEVDEGVTMKQKKQRSDLYQNQLLEKSFTNLVIFKSWSARWLIMFISSSSSLCTVMHRVCPSRSTVSANQEFGLAVVGRTLDWKFSLMYSTAAFNKMDVLALWILFCSVLIVLWGLCSRNMAFTCWKYSQFLTYYPGWKIEQSNGTNRGYRIEISAPSQLTFNWRHQTISWKLTCWYFLLTWSQ